MRRLQRPLDPQAVQAANAAVAAETGGRALTMEPADGALRRKWVDAYLGAGGKEAKGFNSRPVSSSRQTCPKGNWIELEYLYPDDRPLNDKKKGVCGATAIVLTPEGAQIATGTLDSNGFVRIDGLPDDLTEVVYAFDNDPPRYELFPDYRPKPNPLPPPEPDFIDRAGARLSTLASWGWGNVKDGAEWTGGALAGDFNEDPSMGQIVLATAITLIPIVDQAGDVRDISAALKKLIWDKRYDDKWVWFDLVITIIGCIPTVGSAIKGIGKAIKASARGLKLVELLKKLNWIGKGNAVRWVKELVEELPQHGRKAADSIKAILDEIVRKLDTVKKFVTAALARRIDEVLASVREVRKRVDTMVDDAIGELKKHLERALAEFKRLELPGSTQAKNTLKQEKESIEVALDATKGATKQARKVLALGLSKSSKKPDMKSYKEWAKENGWHSYGELSGGGPFSKQIREAMDNADAIHFRLDGVDAKRASGKLNDFGEPLNGNYTNFELWLLKSEPRYAEKVVWFLDGKAMPKGYNPFN